MNIQHLLSQHFAVALKKIGAPEHTSATVGRSTRDNFGHYQFNGAMPLAKAMKQPPRDIASQILNALELDEIAEKLEIAGPGFINIHLSAAWLAQQVDTQARAAQQDKLIDLAPHSGTIVVDYSSPNLAKEMHVGHLRSTIIGDAVAKTLEALGHEVLRQNHMGDWGTQFGMLLAHLSDKLENDQLAETALSDLEDFYRQAKQRFDNEAGFADRARLQVVQLQSGDSQCLQLWQQFVDVSITHSEKVYQKLNVSLERAHIMGESAYNDDLAKVVDDLTTQGIAQQDQGAQVVFLPEMADKEGNPAVYIVQKKDGGYLYATTDLAAIRYRDTQLGAVRTLIFTDARQALHFKQTEIVARKAGYLSDDQQYQHCPLGMMLGDDGKPFKTRSGGTVKLDALLDEAIERAHALISARESNLSDHQKQQVAMQVGIGAVKYADLSKHRTTDYVFDWDSMLSFEGNTAPYLQYAYTRIQSIFRKSDMALENAPIMVEHPQEKALAVKLLQLNEAIEQVATEATPHVLCSYLYDLAGVFMRFYESCPIIKQGTAQAVKVSRLQLTALTGHTLKAGLDILGIATPQQM